MINLPNDLVDARGYPVIQCQSDHEAKAHNLSVPEKSTTWTVRTISSSRSTVYGDDRHRFYIGGTGSHSILEAANAWRADSAGYLAPP